jgi:type VI protein secretion system component VasK
VVASTKNNGDLFAVQSGQPQEHNQRAHVDAKSLQQPVGQNLAQLQQQVEQQSQTLAQQPKVNTPSLV